MSELNRKVRVGKLKKEEKTPTHNADWLKRTPHYNIAESRNGPITTRVRARDARTRKK